jgi:hypothetical protein
MISLVLLASDWRGLKLSQGNEEMSWTTLTVVIGLLLATVLLPFVAYLTIKLGTYAHLRAKDLYREHHPRKGAKNHGDA